jgi:hypothetical protein
VSWLVGCAVGRWNVRMGRQTERQLSSWDPIAPVAVCPPGMLVDEHGLPSSRPPADYPLQLSPGRILVDEQGHPSDVVFRVMQAAEVVFDDAEAILGEVDEVLGMDLRRYLRRGFFKAHLSRYSKSRRNAPIYWPLSTSSGRWGIWIYAPILSRETLFAITGEAARREALAAEAIRRLQAEREAGDKTRRAREINDALAAEETLAEELRRFKLEAERVAGLGWEPDLDDGIVLCAAPLAGLFPAWPEAGKERERIRKGEYPWALVSRWKDVL